MEQLPTIAILSASEFSGRSLGFVWSSSVASFSWLVFGIGRRRRRQLSPFHRVITLEFVRRRIFFAPADEKTILSPNCYFASFRPTATSGGKSQTQDPQRSWKELEARGRTKGRRTLRPLAAGWRRRKRSFSFLSRLRAYVSE